LRGGDQPCGQCIALDVPSDHEEMLIALDGEAAEQRQRVARGEPAVTKPAALSETCPAAAIKWTVSSEKVTLRWCRWRCVHTLKIQFGNDRAFPFFWRMQFMRTSLLVLAGCLLLGWP